MASFILKVWMQMKGGGISVPITSAVPANAIQDPADNSYILDPADASYIVDPG